MRGRSLALANLGLSRIGLGRVEEGKALVLRSLEYDQLEGLRNDMALTHAELGVALERAGDFAGAVQALHTARRLQSAAQPYSGPRRPTTTSSAEAQHSRSCGARRAHE
jgi:tetratricopeptide (TPR) repeat protein